MSNQERQEKRYILIKSTRGKLIQYSKPDKNNRFSLQNSVGGDLLVEWEHLKQHAGHQTPS